jgi:hypothetical protein
MDDDEEEREFSKSIVYDFFTQAEGTFNKMDAHLYLTLFHILFALWLVHRVR